MDTSDLKPTLVSYAGRPLAERKAWYSAAAADYDRVRPRYPQVVIDTVAEAAHLTGESQLLEVGCGPGTATVGFATLGCGITALEPNRDFFQLAQRNCQPYTQVTLHNVAFEEWSGDTKFDAVLAASSFHWIPTEVGYAKAAQVLKPNGHLILLWNKELFPAVEVVHAIAPIYQHHAPHLPHYQDLATQEQILAGLGENILNSGYFHNLVTAGYERVQVTYTVEDYLTLLNTYSPYLKLDPSVKAGLFADLSTYLTAEYGGEIQLSFVAGFHVAAKC